MMSRPLEQRVGIEPVSVLVLAAALPDSGEDLQPPDFMASFAKFPAHRDTELGVQ